MTRNSEADLEIHKRAKAGDQQRLDQLEARADQLEQELRHMRALVAEARHEILPPSTPAPVEPVDQVAAARTVDRRSLLRKGSAAAGAVVGGAALVAASSQPAAAANGQPVLLGQANSATLTTSIFAPFKVESSLGGLATDVTNLSSTGHAFRATAYGSGTAVEAVSFDGPALIIKNGNYAALPTSGFWHRGTFLVVGSQLYFCNTTHDGNSPTSWTRVSTSFVPLDASVRVYDSRPNTQPVAGTKTKFANHEERTLSLSVNNAIPSAVSPYAVVLNLTATNTNPGGYFTAWRSTIPWPNTSSVNWSSANQTIANQTTVKVDGVKQVKVRCEGEGGADLVVDVVGYYL